MQVLPNLLPVVTYEVSCDWRFEPPNTLLTQEGLQLAVASFHDHGSSKFGSMCHFLSPLHVFVKSPAIKIE